MLLTADKDAASSDWEGSPGHLLGLAPANVLASCQEHIQDAQVSGITQKTAQAGCSGGSCIHSYFQL